MWFSFNLPLYFWMKQSEDVKRAGYDLEAAREDLNSIKVRTAAKVTILGGMRSSTTRTRWSIGILSCRSSVTHSMRR